MPGPVGGDGSNEVGRVSVRVVPDATGFRDDLEEQLKAQTAGVTGEVDVKANLVGAEKAEAKLDAVARDRTANIDTDLNADKLAAQTKAAAAASTAEVEVVGDIDRFQRRLLADLQSSLGKMDVKFALTPEGEDLRRQAEDTVSRIANQIKLEIPLDLAEAAQARQLSKDLVDNAKAYEKSLAKLQEPLVFDVSQYSFKQIDAFERRVQKLKNTIASEELTIENTALDDRVKYKLTKSFDKLIQDVKAEEFTYDNTLISDKAFARTMQNFKKFTDELRRTEFSFDNSLISAKDQFAFLQKFDKFKIQVELDTEKARVELAALQKEAADRMTLRPDFYAVDPSEWFGELDALKVKAELDTAEAEIAWDRTAQRLEQERWNAKITPSVDMAPVDSFIDRVRARFRNAKFQVEVGSLKADDFDFNRFEGGASLAARAARGLADVGAAAASAVPGLLSFKGVLLLVIAAVAILLPPLLALAAGLISLAPGLLAIGVPIAAVALGLEGIKNAAKAVKPEFEALKKTMSDTFENGMPGMTGFTAQFERLKGEFFPLLQQELPKVAQGLTSLFSGVVDALSSEKGLGNLRNIIDNVAEGLDRAKGGMAGFTEGLLQLISGISEKFPGLGEWFTDLGEKFAKNMTEWTTIEDDNGFTKLERLIANVRTGIEGLTGVFQAFWNQGLKDISDPNFGAGMKSFFTGVEEFVKNTLPALSEGFKELARLLDTLDPLFKLISAGTNGAKIFTDPGGTVKDMVDRANKVKEAGGSLADQFKAAFLETGPVDPFKGLPGKGEEAGKNARTEFDKGFNGGVPGQPGAAMPAPTATPEAPDTSWWDTFKLKVSTGITEIKTWFSNLWVDIQTTAATAFATLYTSMSTFLAGIPLFFANLPLLIGTALGQITGTIFTFFVNLPAQIAGALAGIPAVIASAFGGIAGIVVAKGSEMIAEVSSWPGRILGALGSLAGLLIAEGAALVAGLISGITSRFGEATAELSSWPGKLRDAVGDLSGVLVNAGVQLIAGFIRGFTSKAGEALETVKRWAGLLRSAAEGVLGIASPSRVFIGIGEYVGEGFQIGLENSQAGVVNQVKEMTNAVIAAGQVGPESFKTLQDLLSLQSQAADLQANGASKAEKAELDHIKDFNSLVQSRLKMRDSELKTMTKMNDLQVDAWKQGQQINKEQKKSVGQQAQAMKDGFKDALEPLTQLTPDLLGGRGKSTIYEAGKIDFTTKAELDALKIKQQEIDMQKSLLQLQSKSSDSPELKNQIALLDTQKARLALQAEELEYWSKYVDTSRDLNDRYEEAGAKLQDMPIDFAKATGQQLMSDLGMSGNGMIPQLLTEGTKYIFNVAGVDDALSAQQRLQNKRSQGLVGR
jgi:hypothetical protein